VTARRTRTIAAAIVLPLGLVSVLIARIAAGSDAPPVQADRPGVADASADGTASSRTSSIPEGLRAVSADDAAGADSLRFAAAASTSSSSYISSTFPSQSRATQVSGQPATYYWAFLVGINDYAGSTESNVGSRQDAELLSKHLLGLGWRSDHIILMRDSKATASHILAGIRWLASKTNGSSTVVFHYSGHENWKVTSADGDNESRDVAIWAYDNRLILDGNLGREMNKVRAQRMWIDFATCRAAGFSDAGMIKAGRVLTYSSPTNEYSYEDPRLHHSVFGYYVISEGMVKRYGDANHNGITSVEEAFYYAKKRVTKYTSGQQHPTIVDKLSGELQLRVPKPPSSSGSSSTPAPSPSTEPQTCVFVCF